MSSGTDNARGLGEDGAFNRLSRLLDQEEHLLQSAFQAAYSHEGLALLGPKDPGVIGELLIFLSYLLLADCFCLSSELGRRPEQPS